MCAGGKKGSKARQNGGKGKRMNVPFTTDGQLGQRLAESSLGSHQGNMINDFIIAHLRTPCSMCPEYCDKVRACSPFPSGLALEHFAECFPMCCCAWSTDGRAYHSFCDHATSERVVFR